MPRMSLLLPRCPRRPRAPARVPVRSPVRRASMPSAAPTCTEPRAAAWRVRCAAHASATRLTSVMRASSPRCSRAWPRWPRARARALTSPFAASRSFSRASTAFLLSSMAACSVAAKRAAGQPPRHANSAAMHRPAAHLNCTRRRKSSGSSLQVLPKLRSQVLGHQSISDRTAAAGRRAPFVGRARVRNAAHELPQNIFQNIVHQNWLRAHGPPPEAVVLGHGRLLIVLSGSASMGGCPCGSVISPGSQARARRRDGRGN